MSETSHKNLYNLLAKKLAGEASEQEWKELERLVESSEEAKNALSNAHHIWSSVQFEQNNTELVSQKEVNEKIWHATFLNEKKLKSYRDNSFIIKIAATLIIFLSAAFVIFKVMEKPVVEEVVVEKITKKTLPGQKSTFTLRDGTIVWLNSGSSISYWTDYNEKIRLIELEGQAFFEVFKDPNKPFLVKCRDLKVESLGTSFDVNGYEDKPIQVSLLTGKVKLSLPMVKDTEEQQILLPGEYSVLSQDNKFIEKGKFNSYEILAWKEGRIIFNDATIKEIIPKLELWYGVEISNDMVFNTQKPFTATFEKENLDNILMNIKDILQFDYTIKGNKVIIKN